ncbi:Copper-exporting P-type ATPase B [uncultured archaeon]|nr:Copper-exporting P-type ATPase B [uncultured archaeon]
MTMTGREGPAHALPEEELLAGLGSGGQNGLGNSEAAARLQKNGPNTWSIEQKATALDILYRQVSNILILLLVVSSIVAAAVGHWPDAIGILIAAILSVTFGFLQEYKAEEALGELQKLTAPRARVVREGREMEVPARELVVGDLLILHEGDLVPADARLIAGSQMRTDQSTLTGESEPVQKHAGECPAHTAMAERSNLVYAGTQVVYGSGRGVVTATGLASEFGRIAQKLAQTESEQTPLQKSLGQLGDTIGKVSIGLCILFFAIGLARGEPWDAMLLTSVSLAVAAIPEGLPTVLAITLGIGVQRMAAEKALVRKLQAVETLGCASVICTDKTGTLTANKMTAVRANLAGEEYAFEGGPYELGVSLRRADGKEMGAPERKRAQQALMSGVLCNEAGLLMRADGQVEGMRGDPTEGALLVAGAKAGLDVEALRGSHVKVAELAFDYHRKMMTEVRREGGKRIAYVKGAPERVLEKCTHVMTAGGPKPLTPKRRAELQALVHAYAKQALRTLALAQKEVKKTAKGPAADESLEKNLCWTGLMGLIDPPRPEAAEAIRLCKKAGIRVVMLTGDAPATAEVIARQLGIMDGGQVMMTGEELERMDEELLRERIGNVAVLARATPEHKYRIVTTLQKCGEVVAVTGDGVNDAPSIKRADIGVAMGMGGTDVARAAADMVLVDNNFSNLVKAAEQGRSIFENIRSFVRYQFTTNVAALTLMFVTPLMGLGMPLMPLQILWINIIMDGPPALALGLEPGRPDAMSKPPRAKDAPFVSAPFLASIVSSGLLMFVLTLGAFGYYSTSLDAGTAAKAGTMAFSLFIILQLVNAFNCRSTQQSAWHNLGANRWLVLAVLVSLALQLAILYTPAMEEVFNVKPLGLGDWMLIAAGGLAMLVWEEARKRVWPKLEA